MSTRSATNKRTQSREYTGMTRKSAASAKPARAAASSVRVVPATAKERRRQVEQGESLAGLSKEEKKVRKQEMRVKEDRIYSVANILMKQDAEYRSKRRIFWAFMAVGVVAILVVWFLMSGILSNLSSDIANAILIVGLVIAYGCVIGSFIYDMVKIRPLRNFYKAQAAGMSDRKLLDVLEHADENERGKKTRGGNKDTSVSATDAADAEKSSQKRGPKKNHRSRR